MTNLYKEELGLATIYDEQWTLIIGINLTNTHERMYTINKLKDFLVQNCDSKCPVRSTVNNIVYRYNRLKTKEILLHNIMGKTRFRRGLFNFVGDISKTLFGTLSQNDIDQVNHEFDQVYSDNKKVAEIVKNNTKIIKVILDSSSQDMQGFNDRLMIESQLMKQLVNASNENRKQLLLQDKITTLEIFISEMSEDLTTALNAINIGKHGMIESTIVTPAIIKSTIQEFETQHKTRYHFEGQETNYQRIIDSADINILTKKDSLIYILKLPVLKNEILTIERIIPLPNRQKDGTFSSIILDHEYLLTGRYIYVPTDKESLSKCKPVDGIKVCKRQQPDFLTYQQNTCDASLLNTHSKVQCKVGTFLLQPETYIPISNGYIAIFTKTERIDVICPNHSIDSQTINVGTFIITGQNCKIMSPRISLNVKNNDLNVTRTVKSNLTYDLDIPDMTLIKNKMILLPNIVDSNILRNTHISLENAESILDTISSHHRIQTWKENALEWLRYLGYTSLGIITFLTLYKIGLFNAIIDLVKRLIGNCYTNCSFGNKANTTHRQEAVPMITTNVSVPRTITPRSLKF